MGKAVVWELVWMRNVYYGAHNHIMCYPKLLFSSKKMLYEFNYIRFVIVVAGDM